MLTRIAGVEPCRAVRLHRHGRVLIDAEPGQGTRGIEAVGLGEKREQPAEAVARIEMTVGEDMLQQFVVQEAALDRYGLAQRIGHGPRGGYAYAVHAAVQPHALNRQASTRTAQWFAREYVRVDRRVQRRTAPHADIVGLVAAGDEDAVGCRHCCQQLRVRGRFAVGEQEGAHR